MLVLPLHLISLALLAPRARFRRTRQRDVAVVQIRHGGMSSSSRRVIIRCSPRDSSSPRAGPAVAALLQDARGGAALSLFTMPPYQPLVARVAVAVARAPVVVVRVPVVAVGAPVGVARDTSSVDTVTVAFVAVRVGQDSAHGGMLGIG